MFFRRVRGLVRGFDGSEPHVVRARAVRRLAGLLAVGSSAAVAIAVLAVLEGARRVVE
jgi:hypothetical protein